MNFQDKVLKCADCEQEFTFTAGEQEFYASRGLQNEPRRCPECRRAKKAEGTTPNVSGNMLSVWQRHGSAVRAPRGSTCIL